MVKHLRRLGHEVTVLTTSGFGALRGESQVVRTSDLMARAGIRRVLRAPALPDVGRDAGPDRPPSRLTTGALVPDSQLASWVPCAFRATRQLLRDRAFDCIVTSSPPESTHLIPLALGRARPAWLADFRDGWRFESWRPEPLTRLHSAVDAWLERQVVTRADAVAVVARTLADDFGERFGIDATYVPGGWDPDLEPQLPDAEVPRPDTRRVSLTYTGKLWGPPGRDPSAFFEALRRLRAHDASIGDRVEVLIAGPLDSEEAARLDAFGLAGIVRHLGHIPREDALVLQRRADVLLLVTSRQRSNVTGKVWEYLAARRPILALAADNEAAWLVEQTHTGITVPPDDVDAIARALRRVIDGDLNKIFEPRGVDQYAYPGPALQLSHLIETAIDRAERRALASAR